MKAWAALAGVMFLVAALVAGEEAPAVRAPTTRPATQAAAGGDGYWVEPMKQVHAKFKGQPGTFACFGDSITVTMAFWSSLKYDHKNMDEKTDAAFKLVDGYMKADCWSKWKGDEYGNTGMMTMKWAQDNVDKWLKKLNPEVVLIMFGTNDLGAFNVEQYEKMTRDVVAKCLDNGTVVILSTLPPRGGALEKAKSFAEAARKVARDLKVPVCEYFQACLDRRPEDWNGAMAKFKGTYEGDEYQVPTLIAADGTHPSNPKQWVGDYSAEGLKHNGYVLRNYVSLHAYAEVITKVLKAGEKPAEGQTK